MKIQIKLANDEMIVRSEMPEYKTGTVVRIGGLLTTKLFTKTSSIN
jgi:hypothetical protein